MADIRVTSSGREPAIAFTGHTQPLSWIAPTAPACDRYRLRQQRPPSWREAEYARRRFRTAATHPPTSRPHGRSSLSCRATHADQSRGSSLKVYSTEESLGYAGDLSMSLDPLYASTRTLPIPQRDTGLPWYPTQEGERLQLGPTTYANPFAVDHLPGAVGWRIDQWHGDRFFGGHQVQPHPAGVGQKCTPAESTKP